MLWRRGAQMVVGLLALTVTSVGVAAAPFLGRWAYIKTIPGGTACAVRRHGREVDTMMMLNRNGQLVLIAGRTGWQGAGPETIAIRVDRGPIDRLKADVFNNLVMVRISSQAILKRLEVAKSLLWYMPTGEYRAEVAGLGGALKWLYRCEAKKHLQRQ